MLAMSFVYPEGHPPFIMIFRGSEVIASADRDFTWIKEGLSPSEQEYVEDALYLSVQHGYI